MAKFTAHSHFMSGTGSAEKDGGVGTADTGVNVLDQHIPLSYLGEGKLFQLDLFFSFVDCCFHGVPLCVPGRATHCCMMAQIF